MVVVKFQYGNDVRRITLPDSIAYEEVLSVVERIYGGNALPRDFHLKYGDEVRDCNRLTACNDLREIISKLPKGKILRLTIVDAHPAPSSTGISVATIDENLHNALCRHCGRQVQGVRFVCVNCASGLPDGDHYSLCAECEVQRPHDPQHVFLKLYAPLPSDALARVLPLPNLYAPSAPSSAAPPRGAQQECPNWIRQRKNVAVDLDRATQEQGNELECRFVADITVDDGDELTPGAPFVKIWRLRNSGRTAWPEGLTLAFVSGDWLSPFDSVPVITVSPGAEVDVSVDMVAPMETGRYVSNWRLRSPSGVYFGHRVWADIKVAAGPPSNDLENSGGRNEGGGQSVQNDDDDSVGVGDDVDDDEGEDDESGREWGQIRRSSKVHKIAKVIRSSLNSEVDICGEDGDGAEDEEGEVQAQPRKEEEEEEESTEEVADEEEEEEEKSTEEVAEEKSELLPLEILPVEKEGDADDDGEWEVVQQEERVGR